MRLFIILFLLSAFIQTSFLHLNIALILIICRSFISEDSDNYFIAFFLGLILGILSAQNIGFWPAVFLVSVKIIHLLKKLPISSHFLIILPATLMIATLAAYLEKVFLGGSINYLKIIIETVISLPVYLMIRFWEERFVVRPEVKLKIRR